MMVGVMGLAYWPGSSTEKRLKEMAKRLRGKIATEFSGVTVGGVKVLCRTATAYMQPSRGEKYGRWHWKVPFGREADWRKVDYVLLHGPEMGQYDEAFFLFTVREAREHLEYCGYGDKWERECAVEKKLEQQIKEAITEAENI